MSAAQNTVDPVIDAASGTLGRFVELIMQLPGWLRDTVVVMLAVVIMARTCVPPVLRAIDDHLLVRRARKKITSAEDWVDVLRIRDEPRRMIGRRPPTQPRAEPSDPKAGARDGEPSGDAEDDPP